MSLVTCCCVASENGGNSDPKVSDNFYYYLDDCFSLINMDDMKPGLDIILNTDNTLFQNIHIKCELPIIMTNKNKYLKYLNNQVQMNKMCVQNHDVVFIPKAYLQKYLTF